MGHGNGVLSHRVVIVELMSLEVVMTVEVMSLGVIIALDIGGGVTN